MQKDSVLGNQKRANQSLHLTSLRSGGMRAALAAILRVSGSCLALPARQVKPGPFAQNKKEDES